MPILVELTALFVQGMKELYDIEISVDSVQLSTTRREFEGDYTIILFPYLRGAKKKPEALGAEIGDYLRAHHSSVVGHNTIKGFLNVSLSHRYWKDYLLSAVNDEAFGTYPSNGKTVMVEFASPNTNKPLHLGHIRNILLGWSTSQILKAAGYRVLNTQIINDRGIAVCKSMLAWQLYGDGATPESTGVKGDHLVGQYYVAFDKAYKAEYESWQSTDQASGVYEELHREKEQKADFYKRYKNDYFNTYSSLGSQAKEMLLKWEAGDADVVALWKTMNGWVYQGFDKTYEALGVSFDKLYYESDTYLLGKASVDRGLQQGIFYSKEDGSAWIDLTDAGMDEKIVLRSDGTAVYMTQDIGTAQVRNRDYGIDKMVYVVGNEQDYHFKVLFEIMKRLEEPFAAGLYHLSYGMVDLPSGRMKSREGTVVDADDLVREVIDAAAESTKERGEIESLPAAERVELHRVLGLAALKFFILKVQPQKGMTFDPHASVDMQGQTGPYIQNAYVRIQSMMRKAGSVDTRAAAPSYIDLHELEVHLLRDVAEYPQLVLHAAEGYDPALLANYCYGLAKDFHRYYHDVRILSAETDDAKLLRLQLCQLVAKTLQQGMCLLGIDMPQRM